jgi:hypothetical protein
MTPKVVHDFLREVGKQWLGQGVAMELGCWLGASSIPLLEGLVEAGYDRPFWAFDRWRASADQVVRAARDGVTLTSGQDLSGIYMHNVVQVYGNVNAYRGNLPEILKKYDGSPIEICVFDAPKTDPVFRQSMDVVMPHFIPGVTILGLLDYYSYNKHSGPKRDKMMAPVKFIVENEPRFHLMNRWPGVCSCAFFRFME